MLRILATWDPSSLPEVDLTDPELAAECGGVPGLEEGEAFAVQWDRREDYVLDDECDLGRIGENDKGVWATVHPASLLACEPLLWGVVTRWRYGVREMTPALLRKLSAYEAQAMVVLMSAHAREEARRMRQAQEGADRGDSTAPE